MDNVNLECAKEPKESGASLASFLSFFSFLSLKIYFLFFLFLFLSIFFPHSAPSFVLGRGKKGELF